MTHLILQTVLVMVAGCAVYALWRRVASNGRAVFWLVTFGVLARAGGGQLAFWVSYLNLPLARSLQVGRGLWMFAVDAIGYFDRAVVSASGGPAAIVSMSKTEISVVFVQILATALWLFGSVTSVAILLNVAAYLGCCAMALWLGRGMNDRAVVFTIAVLSLSPSAIVWSLQPLKDVSFLFFVTAFFGVARVWQQVWAAGRGTRRQLGEAALWMLVMAALVYAISGIRWYFGLVLVLATVPFVVMAILRARARLVAAISALFLLPLLGAAFLSGAGPYVPPPLRAAVFSRGDARPTAIPEVLLTTLDDSRKSFDHASGNSLIGAGGTIAKLDHSLGVKEVRVEVTPQIMPAPAAAPSQPVAAPSPAPAPAAAPTPAPPLAAPPLAEPAMTPPAANATEGGAILGTVTMPSSPIARFLAGAAAVILPRTVAQRLGILNVGGGRGMWLFVEIDTLAFDVVLLIVLASIVRAVRARSLRAPLFWLIFIVTAVIGAALAYTVSNFGTLFRHRDMVLLGLALIPLAILPARDETSRAAA